MLNIERLNFYQGSDEPHFFHPAVCSTGNQLLMTMQSFNGAGDTYGPIEYAISNDNGKSWSETAMIAPLASREIGDGITEGIADVRPFYHQTTDTVIAIGCNTYYGAVKQIIEDRDFNPAEHRQAPIYAIRYADGSWSERKILNHPFFTECYNWRVASAQLAILPNGEMIIPIYCAPTQAKGADSVITLHCSFDGENITVEKLGKRVDSGDCTSYFVEPSVVYFANKFILTLRTGEERAYMAISDDGLNWNKVSSWHWDDGEPLLTTNTQQHWLQLKDKLYLVYTRSADDNQDVMRWRAPLFMAEVDVDRLVLKRDTEQIALPLVRKNNIAYVMGNFHVSTINSNLAIISDAPLWFRVEKGAVPEEDYIAEYDSFVSLAKINTIN
ncbi:MAG: glycoside hydrolase [Victivallaceae bacterium]|nr:glycoside hydrolase [Victivallaceae bacterium]